STFPAKALRVCLGGTSTSSSAVPGCSTPALRLDLGGAVSSSRCSTTRNPSSSWCSTFPEKALRVCLGGTSTSSSAVPGCSAPALRLNSGGAVSSSWCSTTRNPSSSWCSTFPGEGVQSLPGRDEHQLVRGAGVQRPCATPRLAQIASLLANGQRRNQVAVDLLPGYGGGGGQAQVVLLEYPVGAVAGAYQRAGGHFHEALGQAQFAVVIEFVGGHPALDRQVVAGRLQVLAEGDDIHADGA